MNTFNLQSPHASTDAADTHGQLVGHQRHFPLRLRATPVASSTFPMSHIANTKENTL